MNKNIKHKFLAGAMLVGFMLAGSSCEEKVVIRVTPETPFADKTLFEVLTYDNDYSDFVEVLNACGTHCADSLFNHSRVYTLWAPVNGTFNKDSIIAETVADEEGNSNRDHVFRTFIQAHVANHLHPANGVLEDNPVTMLNSKIARFEGDYKSGYTFDGSVITEPNIRVRNGIIHKMAAPSEYKYSIWEYLKIAADVDSVAEYLYSYNVTEFSEGQSIKGPIVNGEQTYLDSVFTTSNTWLNSWGGVGNIDSEDSTYIVYVPDNNMWSKVVAAAEKHFNYDLSFVNMTEATKIERDSLRKYYARLHNLKYMTYSKRENDMFVEATDSSMPAYRSGKRPLFSNAELEENVTFEKELSNGIFKVVSAMPYKQTDLWHDTIFLEGENNSMWNYGENIPAEVENLAAFKSQLNKKDSTLLDVEVSGGYYFSYSKSSGTATAKFKIPKVLSAKYEVAIVFVPKNITNEFTDTATMYPNKYKFTIKQAPGVGAAKTLFNTKTKGEFYTNKFGMDTVYLTADGSRDGERAIVEFPYCEFYNGSAAKDYNVTLEIASVAATNAEKRKGINYDTSIRVDKIILIPVLDTEE